jgi:archaemetzincin
MLLALLFACVKSGTASPRSAIIAVAPVGSVDPNTIAELVPTLREAFRAEIVVAPPIALPRHGWNASRGQQLSTAILDELAQVRQPRWERLLGVCDVDLYVPDLNFVFGEADPARAVAVFSVRRLGSAASAEARQQFERRAATEAIHELGHTYGLRHCNNPHCVMWFSNTLAETDRKGTAFCATHAAELARVRGK